MQQSRKTIPTLKIEKKAYLYLSGALLLLPLRCLLAFVVAAVVHELGHILVLYLLKIRIYNVEFGVFGAKIDTECMAPWQELLCALAGPISGFTLLLFFRWMPLTAIFGIFQSLYNLLPVYPGDGGRILQSCANMLLPPNVAQKICRIIEVLFLISAAGIGIYLTFCLRLGLIPIVISALLIRGWRKKHLQTWVMQSTMGIS